MDLSISIHNMYACIYNYSCIEYARMYIQYLPIWKVHVFLHFVRFGGNLSCIIHYILCMHAFVMCGKCANMFNLASLCILCTVYERMNHAHRFFVTRSRGCCFTNARSISMPVCCMDVLYYASWHNLHLYPYIYVQLPSKQTSNNVIMKSLWHWAPHPRAHPW